MPLVQTMVHLLERDHSCLPSVGLHTICPWSFLSIRIACLPYFHTLLWLDYVSTTTTSSHPSSCSTNKLSSCPEVMLLYWGLCKTSLPRATNMPHGVIHVFALHGADKIQCVPQSIAFPIGILPASHIGVVKTAVSREPARTWASPNAPNTCRLQTPAGREDPPPPHHRHTQPQ